MKQGDRFLKLVICLLAATCLIYLGGAAIHILSNPLTTVTAQEFTADVSVSTVGLIVRDEMQLTSPYDDALPIPAEGRRVSAGQILALSGQSDCSPETLAALRQQITAYSTAIDSNISKKDLDTAIDARLTDCAVRAALRQTSQASSDALKGLILRDSADSSALQTRFSALESRLEILTSHEEAGIHAITAAHAGWFSARADGYEAILTPHLLETLDAQNFPALAHAAIPLSDNVYGKLIRSGTWYYVTVLESTQLTGVEIGNTVSVSMGNALPQSISMRVERLDRSNTAACVLVLSCDEYIQDVASLRMLDCILTFRTYEGLQIPKESVKTDGARRPGVYVLEGAVARWIPVDILLTTPDYYIVRCDRTDAKQLWPGAEILLGNNLYDGKVVQQS